MVFVEPLRGDDLGVHPALPQPTAESKPEAAGLVDDVQAVSLAQEAVDPGQEVLGSEGTRRSRRGVVVLGDDDVFALVDVEAELDFAASLGGGGNRRRGGGFG